MLLLLLVLPIAVPPYDSALIFDSFYDSYRGIIAQVSIKEGSIKVGEHIIFMSNGLEFEVTELGRRTPKEEKVDEPEDEMDDSFYTKSMNLDKDLEGLTID